MAKNSKNSLKPFTLLLAIMVLIGLGALLVYRFQSATILAPETGAYTGVGVPVNDPTLLDQFTKDSGEKPAIILDYIDWEWFPDFPTARMDKLTARGAYPLLTWEPWDSRADTKLQASYKLSKIIDGAHDTYISRWAQQMKKWDKPIMLRFAHEMNGDWYSRSEGVNGNVSGEYVKAYQHVHDIFTHEGANNVSWVWTPNIEEADSTPIGGLFPGDAYVDWVGLDGYNFGAVDGHSWRTFEQTFATSITTVRGISSKPFIIAETACGTVGGDKAAWITDFFARLTARPEIKAFVWFNYNKGIDYRIESSASAQAAYKAGIASNRWR